MADSAHPRAWIDAGEGSPRSVPLEPGKTTFGRGDVCDVTIADEAVSWEHLEIEARGPSLLATDLDSRNGTLLNGEPLEKPRRLRNGDVLQLGGIRVEISFPPQERPSETVAAPAKPVALTADEQGIAAALVAPYKDPDVLAGRPATRAEVAEALHVSERTVQRRLEGLALKLGIPADAGRDRSRLIAEQILHLGLDRDA